MDGDDITWKASITKPMPMTLEFSGTVDGDNLKGNVKLGMFGSASLHRNARADGDVVTVERISGDDLIAAVAFDAAGLVPAIAQDAKTGEVLMLAWMNRDALNRTLETGRRDLLVAVAQRAVAQRRHLRPHAAARRGVCRLRRRHVVVESRTSGAGLPHRRADLFLPANVQALKRFPVLALGAQPCRLHVLAWGALWVVQQTAGARAHCPRCESSDELHRTVLANVSDAVFLTDSNGQFTFVCLNVDVIFGFVPDEVHAMAGIELLLGENSV